MSRTPPSAGPVIYNDPISVYAFDKNEGSVSSTFVGRIISRVPIRLVLKTGEVIDAVRYAGRYWPIYEPETFSVKSREWVNDDDALYGEDYAQLKLPLKHAYLFGCDDPKGFYE